MGLRSGWRGASPLSAALHGLSFAGMCGCADAPPDLRKRRLEKRSAAQRAPLLRPPRPRSPGAGRHQQQQLRQREADSAGRGARRRRRRVARLVRCQGGRPGTCPSVLSRGLSRTLGIKFGHAADRTPCPLCRRRRHAGATPARTPSCRRPWRRAASASWAPPRRPWQLWATRSDPPSWRRRRACRRCPGAAAASRCAGAAVAGGAPGRDGGAAWDAVSHQRCPRERSLLRLRRRGAAAVRGRPHMTLDPARPLSAPRLAAAPPAAPRSPTRTAAA
jgi:hypothetical protein